MPADPVNGKSFWLAESLPDDCLHTGSVHVHSQQLPLPGVDEVKLSISEVVVQSDDIVQSLSQNIVRTTVDRQTSDVVAITEYQPRLHVCITDEHIVIVRLFYNLSHRTSFEKIDIKCVAMADGLF